MTTVTGRRYAAGHPEPVADCVEELVARHADAVAGASSLVVLPDAHYPYHPSTGLVTDPAVVAAVVRALGQVVDAPVTVAVGGSPALDAERTSRYLGYRRALADTEATLAAIGDDGSPPTADGDALPSPIAGAAVVNVPTLRRSSSLGAVAGTANLAQAAGVGPDPAPDAVRRAARRVDCRFTLLDGTCVFAGRPARTRFLLACEETAALDRLAVSLLGVDPGDVPYLPPAADPPRLAGFGAADVREQIRGSDDPVVGGGPGPLVQAGYRLYSRLSGDGVPPAFVGGADE